MGAIGGLLGLGQGYSGTNATSPNSLPLTTPINQQQLNQANTGAANATAAQNALLAALQQQGGLTQQQNATAGLQQQANLTAGMGGTGLQNTAAGQQQAFNTQAIGANGIGQQSAVQAQNATLASQLAAARGVNTQQQAIQGLQGVAGSQANTLAQLQGVANGTGPNPAQAMLNQQTGQNVANQAALMAGQRGAGANVGLMARQIAQQGAATQQQAVGQGASMQAQQSLGALGQMQGQQQAMAGTQSAIGGLGTTQIGQQQAGLGLGAQIAGTQVGQQQAGVNALAGQGQAQTGQALSAASQLAGQTNTLANQQISTQNAAVQNALAQQQNALGGVGGLNQANVGMQSNINNTNTSLANTQMQGQQQLIGGAAGAIAALFAAEGGVVKQGTVQHFADGGATSTQAPTVQASAPATTPALVNLQPASNPNAPQSSFGQFMAAYANNLPGQQNTSATNNGQTFNNNSTALSSGINKLTTTGINNLSSSSSPLDESDFMAEGGKVRDLKGGGHVKARTPKEKAKKPGNNYSNDTIPAMLSEGEVVIPRSVIQTKNPARGAAEFVAKVLAKRGKK